MTEKSKLTTARRLNRRAFISALTGAGIVAAVSGCRSRAPLPTPTATRTPRALPTLAATDTPGAALSPLATPTAPLSPLASPVQAGAPTSDPTTTPTPSDTPTPTETPSPSPTPTPTATPFPPGPPSKLGLFVTRNDPRIFDLLRTGNVTLVKTLEYDPNFVAEMKSISPQTLVVGRMDLPQVDLGAMSDPQGAAQWFVDQLLPIATEPKRLANIDAWEAYNEPAPGNPDQMARLGEFEARRTELLAAAGIRSCVGNFSAGNPPLEWWPQFRPAVEAAIRHKGYLGLHEYSAPTMQWGTPQDPLGWAVNPAEEGWITLRYRKVYRGYLQPNKLDIPLLLTEVGIDGLLQNRPGPQGKGWRDFAQYWDSLGMGSDAPGNYVEQLAWYDAHLQQDPYVLGSAIFAAAASPGWETYEVLDDVFPFLQQYLSVHPPR
ncbi:MAG: hypothetical protein MUC34_07125 [Anaerolineae bacterium]|jgi:hypothetical protein|nr:hypothetical protein [Anaerolineae bacterium]